MNVQKEDEKGYMVRCISQNLHLMVIANQRGTWLEKDQNVIYMCIELKDKM